VTALEYGHVPTGTLAVPAQRLGKVWAAPRPALVRQFGWRRLRLRVHPAKPKVGLRTTRPDEMWHIDTTVIRLLDGPTRLLDATRSLYIATFFAFETAGNHDRVVWAIEWA
jgi:hypothetical protein